NLKDNKITDATQLPAVEKFDEVFGTSFSEICKEINAYIADKTESPGLIERAGEASRELSHYCEVMKPFKTCRKNTADISAKIKQKLVKEAARTAYEEARRAREKDNVLSFGDMLQKTREALVKDGAGNAPLLQELRDKFKAGIIDEFQDTNPIQWSIIKTIFENKELILVGDPKQSIYSFQGANVKTYTGAVRAAEKKLLPVSRRFSPELCDALNWFFDKQTKPAEGGAENETGSGNQKPFFGEGIKFAPSGFVEQRDEEEREKRRLKEGYFALNVVTDQVISADKSAGQTSGAPAEKQEKNAKAKKRDFAGDMYPRFILNEIKRFEKAAPYEGWTHGDVMVLARKKKQLDRLTGLLRENGIPFTFYKKDGLYSSKEARSLFHALTAVSDPDGRNLGAMLVSDLFGCSLPEARAVLEGEAAESMEKMPVTPEMLNRLVNEWSRMLKNGKDLGAVAEKMIADLDIHAKSLRNGDSRRSANYRQAVARIRALCMDFPSPYLALKELQKRSEAAEKGEQDEDLMPLDTDEKAVRLMTVHSAKGLQNKIVFVLPDSDKNDNGKYYRIPGEDSSEYHIKPGEKDEEHKNLELAEEHRILYVAMTRAERMLYIPDSCKGMFEGAVIRQPGKEETSGFAYAEDTDYGDDSVTAYKPGVGSREFPLSDSVVSWNYVEEIRRFKNSKGEEQPADGPSGEPAETKSEEQPADGGPSGGQEETDRQGGDESDDKEDIKALELPDTHGRLTHIESFTVRRNRFGKQKEAAEGEPDGAPEDDPGASGEDIHTTGAGAGFHGGDDEDHDSEEGRAPEGRLPGGIYTGYMVHEAFDFLFRDLAKKAKAPKAAGAAEEEPLLERIYHADPQKLNDPGLVPEDSGLRRIFERYEKRLEKKGVDVREHVLAILRNTLHTPLPGLGTEIGSLSSETILTELPFFYLDVIDPEKGGGKYLEGTADMLFMRGGEYYILDWKTNLSKSGGYGPEELQDLMEEGKYRMQAAIYARFVNEWLRMAGQEKEVQGAFYVFVRPAEGGEDAAVYPIGKEALGKAIAEL
ncbi:MAG: UvrD-helicase domain-containing protein, partial [Abditibacteriota bacterium]|nr:UvrD-helicase domain-containing protein [Abditibacteriota bacterium]